MSPGSVQFECEWVRVGLQVAVLCLDEEGLGHQGLADLQGLRAGMESWGVVIDVGQEERQGPCPCLRRVALGDSGKGCFSIKGLFHAHKPLEKEDSASGKERPRGALKPFPS